VWTAVAAEEPIAFGDAQRDYAGRNLYRRAVGDTFGATGMNLDDRAHAIRAATWSTSLQHGGAAKLLTRAIQATDKRLERASPGYDSLLLNHIYGQRIGLVKELSEDRENYTDSERRNFRNIIRNRFHEEPRRATRLLELER
jgi:type VI secretion system secreted protein VgrG